MLYEISFTGIRVTMKKRPISFRLDEDLYEFTKHYAERKRLTLTQVLVNLILEFYEQDSRNELHAHSTAQNNRIGGKLK
jgi:hypothetical protein